jgi:hypothetical protein
VEGDHLEVLRVGVGLLFLAVEDQVVLLSFLVEAVGHQHQEEGVGHRHLEEGEGHRHLGVEVALLSELVEEVLQLVQVGLQWVEGVRHVVLEVAGHQLVRVGLQWVQVALLWVPV